MLKALTYTCTKYNETFDYRHTEEKGCEFRILAQETSNWTSWWPLGNADDLEEVKRNIINNECCTITNELEEDEED